MLFKRKGLNKTLLEQVTDKNNPKSHSEIAQEYLVGEAVVTGTASFYDFINHKKAEHKVFVCNGTSCLCAGSQADVIAPLLQHFQQTSIGHVTCLGRCHENYAFQIDGQNYSGNDIKKLDSILNHQYDNNEEYNVTALCTEPVLTQKISDVFEYYALFDKLTSQESPESLLKQLIQSNLRGRGGAGFPTGIKWQTCRNALGKDKYIVCNADEGDPGAFSDRYLLEQNPHSVLFGMLMAGYIVGSNIGILYIRDEYPDAIDLCEQAIEEFEQLNINFDFNFKVIRGAGSYICGEETALLRSIEGQRPEVSIRPPYPAEEGLFNQPTIVNNVETFSAIHWIFEHGAEKFIQRGSKQSSGTKLLSLDSAFKTPGIYEVDMGTPLRTIIDAAGGFSQPVKALHIGGPLGGVVPQWKIDEINVDYESFDEQGFLLGHASIIGIPASFPFVRYIQHLFEFTAKESCGKCFPCRLGAIRGKEIFEEAIYGDTRIDFNLLEDLLSTMKLGSLCALGGGVPLPIQNILEYFSEELIPYIDTSKQSDRIPVKEE